jgi:hypothetical protein
MILFKVSFKSKLYINVYINNVLLLCVFDGLMNLFKTTLTAVYAQQSFTFLF